MWQNVLADLPGVRVTHSIEIGGRSRGEQIGSATEQITRYLIGHPARAVVVQGDTNSTLAGALAAMSLGIPLIHVEAGLRSFDRRMPEETNRVLVDAIADLCCAPVEANAETLRNEGVGSDRIVVTGNTLADAMDIIAPAIGSHRDILRDAGLPTEEDYALCTVHRAALVDHKDSLAAVLGALNDLAQHAMVVLP
ncbi:MAG: UDP-N-acetyl glucosamine 2-epimerase, partial [Brevibacterium aurantiacum]|nr:UDP-N-acetyl glucosamine 2-epimerase [Brevibacterium aurantiacum]